MKTIHCDSLAPQPKVEGSHLAHTTCKFRSSAAQLCIHKVTNSKHQRQSCSKAHWQPINCQWRSKHPHLTELHSSMAHCQTQRELRQLWASPHSQPLQLWTACALALSCAPATAVLCCTNGKARRCLLAHPTTGDGPSLHLAESALFLPLQEPARVAVCRQCSCCPQLPAATALPRLC